MRTTESFQLALVGFKTIVCMDSSASLQVQSIHTSDNSSCKAGARDGISLQKLSLTKDVAVERVKASSHSRIYKPMAVVPIDACNDVEEKPGLGLKEDVKKKSYIQMLTSKMHRKPFTNEAFEAAHARKNYSKLRLCAKYIDIFIDKNSTQAFMVVLLLISLYLSEVWILLNVHTNSDVVPNVILLVIFFAFVCEIALLSCLKTGYILCFFFWMDIVGTLSILLDVSWTNSVLNNQHSSLLRAARTAKLGARSTRLTRLTRIIRLLWFFQRSRLKDADVNNIASRTLSLKLSELLGCRVGLLVMILVIFTPMLIYTQVDVSPIYFLDSTDGLRSVGSCNSTCFDSFAFNFHRFYHNQDTTPLHLRLDRIGHWDWPGRHGYVRSDNIETFSTEDSSVDMDFTRVNQVQAAYNIALVTIVLMVLVGFSLSFHNAVNKIVVLPYQRMMVALRRSAASMLKSFKEMNLSDQLEELDQLEADVETELLEEVIDKLARIVQISGSGQMNELMKAPNLDARTKDWIANNYSKMVESGGLSARGPMTARTPLTARLRKRADQVMLPACPVQEFEDETVKEEDLSTLAFNPLHYSYKQLYRYIRLMLVLTDCLDEFDVDDATLSAFVSRIESLYLNNSYHNFYHGVDVCQTVFRFMQLIRSESLFSQMEIFGLLIAALCHDVGHLGVNNSYLVKTRHPIAMAHNDVSPLENMHCVLIYETLAISGHNIFASLSNSEWTAMRKNVITAILGTDMVHHFQQIDKIKVFYEIHGYQFRLLHTSPSYVPECLDDQRNKEFLMELLLHCADVSNPIKPFNTCLLWAELIMQEFFLQGDKEKAEGLEISPMMNRDSTNKFNMQLNFIEFVVAPLYFGAAKLFPSLNEGLINLNNNFKQWGEKRKSEIHCEHSRDATSAENEIKNIDVRVVAFNSKTMEAVINPPVQTSGRRGKLISNA